MVNSERTFPGESSKLSLKKLGRDAREVLIIKSEKQGLGNTQGDAAYSPTAPGGAAGRVPEGWLALVSGKGNHVGLTLPRASFG